MTPRQALITGGGGQLASDLAEQLGGEWSVSAPTHAQLDITDEAALDAAFEEGPDLVLNCAAFHNVDACEFEQASAYAVNAAAVKSLAARAGAAGAKLVHLSSNYVFDGSRPEPYAEHDRPAPESVYAVSKLAGEHAALAYAPRALVIRTAGLYGLRGSVSKGGNFVDRMLARARAGEELRMVADQYLSPTFTADLAEALLQAVERDTAGVIHLTSEGQCSWYEFTEAIMELSDLAPSLTAVETRVPPGGARRPRNGVLARPAADAAGVAPLRPWRDGLADYIRRATTRS